MMVFTMKMEILLEPTSNKLLVGSFKDGDGDGDTQFQQCQVNNQIPRHDLHLLWSYERSHKGVKASANSEIINFFTSAQDGDALQDDIAPSLLGLVQDHHRKNKQTPQGSARTTSAVDLEEFCKKHYEKLLPIMADNSTRSPVTCRVLNDYQLKKRKDKADIRATNILLQGILPKDIYSSSTTITDSQRPFGDNVIYILEV
ncbi:hypothetical protein Tco_0806148 [Tanacetum coccineum]